MKINATIDTSGKPMMSDKEIEIIDKLIKKHKPKLCLEWGSGNSTIHFSKNRCIKSWTSIEHNGHYIKYLKDKMNDKTTILWIENEYAYINCVVQHDNKYDFILIDGNYRENCLKTAMKVAKDNAIILFHDSGKACYEELFENCNCEKLTDGEIPQKDGFFAHRGLTLIKKI